MNPIDIRTIKGLKRITTAVAVAFVLTTVSPPVFAQRHGGGHAGGWGHPQGTPRSGSSEAGPASPRYPNPNAVRGDYSGRNFDHNRGRYFHRGDHDRAIPRGFLHYDPFFRGWGRTFYPYYPFLEYPWYPDYGYWNQTSGFFEPTYTDRSETRNGGISFDITPADALVYVDNRYAGVASSFRSGFHSLSLGTGSHRIELLAAGFAPVSFELNGSAGQIIPYTSDVMPISGH